MQCKAEFLPADNIEARHIDSSFNCYNNPRLRERLDRSILLIAVKECIGPLYADLKIRNPRNRATHRYWGSWDTSNYYGEVLAASTSNSTFRSQKLVKCHLSKSITTCLQA